MHLKVTMKCRELKCFSTFIFIFRSSSESEQSLQNRISTDGYQITLPQKNGGSESKIFVFDKIFSSETSKLDLYKSFIGSSIRDVLTGYNCSVVVCNSTLDEKPLKMNAECFDGYLAVQSLTDLLLSVNKQEALEATLQVSFIEVCNDNAVFDLLSDDDDWRDLQVFDSPDHIYTEIQGVTEKAIIDKLQIREMLSKGIAKSNKSKFSSKCSHIILSATVILRDVNSDSFETIRNGNFLLVDLGSCVNVLKARSVPIHNGNENHFMNEDEKWGVYPCSMNRETKLFKILKNSFGGNAKSKIIFTVTPSLDSETELVFLECSSYAKEIHNKPEINEKLIIRDSIKEYAEEIQALEKNVISLKEKQGVLIEQQNYRCLENNLALENEKGKDLMNVRRTLSEYIHCKKEKLNRLHLDLLHAKNIIQGNKENCSNLNSELKRINNEKKVIDQDIISEAQKCIETKSMIGYYMTSTQNKKDELLKVQDSYHKALLNIQHLVKMLPSSKIITEEQMEFKASLEELMLHLKQTLALSGCQQHDLLLKVQDLSVNLDKSSNLWKQCTDSITSSLVTFINNYTQDSCNLKHLFFSELEPINVSQREILDIILSKKNENLQIMSNSIHRIQLSCNASIKMLTEMLFFLKVVQTRVKSMLRSLETEICCICKEFKKFLTDIFYSLTSVLHALEEEKKSFVQMGSNTVSHYHLRETFGEEFMKIKHALVAVKELFSSNYELFEKKWNQRHADVLKMKQMYEEVSKYLHLCHSEIPSMLDKMKQKSTATLNDFQTTLLNQTQNMENLKNMLNDKHAEMDNLAKICFEENKKEICKQENEVKRVLAFQERKAIKCFENVPTVVKTNSQRMDGQLKSIENSVSDFSAGIKTSLGANCLSLHDLEKIFSDCLFLSKKISKKSIESCEKIPNKEDKNFDSASSSECAQFQERELISSTPTTDISVDENDVYKLVKKVELVATLLMSEEENILHFDSDCSSSSSLVSLSLLRTEIEGARISGRYCKKQKARKIF
ncbi:kinesin-like protein KIF11 isoform X2 [Stegodyphus dumicola]|uniref:kinesin-like protein KIF11 isoform X2 n=2 Tax=Stegodyphus dumicola TaxID=202533 RepID=UPI0015AD161A|nr:kinesin-like protein KIF11 isoform X2 [Stegodyphus dumicola]